MSFAILALTGRVPDLGIQPIEILASLRMTLSKVAISGFDPQTQRQACLHAIVFSNRVQGLGTKLCRKWIFRESLALQIAGSAIDCRAKATDPLPLIFNPPTPLVSTPPDIF